MKVININFNFLDDSGIQNIIAELRPHQIDPLLKDYVTSDRNNYKYSEEYKKENFDVKK